MNVRPDARRSTASVLKPPRVLCTVELSTAPRAHGLAELLDAHRRGEVLDGHDDCVLFYEGATGFAEIYQTDGYGNISLLRQHADLGRIGNRSHRWTHVVVGRFCDSPYNSLLLADRNSGFAAIFKTDATGNLIMQREFPSWGDWSHITTVRRVLESSAPQNRGR